MSTTQSFTMTYDHDTASHTKSCPYNSKKFVSLRKVSELIDATTTTDIQDLQNISTTLLFKHQSRSLSFLFYLFHPLPRLVAEGRSVSSFRSPLFMEMSRQRRENWFLSILVHTLVILIIPLVSFRCWIDTLT